MHDEDHPRKSKNVVVRKRLLKSHWTREDHAKGKRHFIVEEVHRERVGTVVLRAILDDNVRLTISVSALKDPSKWSAGWRSLDLELPTNADEIPPMT